jgi:hypothetical protein
MKRWYWALLPAAACLSTLGSSSCIQIGPSDDTDAGADAADASSTMLSECTEIWTAYCARAQGCYGQDPQSCLQVTTSECCATSCQSLATTSERTIATCVDDINAESCDGIVINEIPDSCLHIPAH